jgi:hypothetical protein
MDVEQRSGLHEWQGIVVRLWSESDEAFAALTLTWLPEGTRGAPWMARLRYGSEDGQSWSQEIRIGGAPSIQQALYSLSQRAEKLLDKPVDVPEDFWLTAEDLAIMQRVDSLLHERQPIALELGYCPEFGMSACWVAMLHDPARQPPDGVILMKQAGELAQVCELLIQGAKDQDSTYTDVQNG